MTPKEKEKKGHPFVIALPVIALLLTTLSLPAAQPANAKPSIRITTPGLPSTHRQANPNVATTITNTVTPSPTPTTPTLIDVALAPTTAFRASTIVLSYTVFSPVAQQVALGADMTPDGTGTFTNDPNNDRVVSIAAGMNIVTRVFNMGVLSPGWPAGPYTVRWGLFDANFSTQYGLERRASAFNMLDITATPTRTNTPTITPTFTPSPTLPPMPPMTSGLPQHFTYGLFNATTSNIPAGIPIEWRYQYLAGGVNTGDGWYTWSANGAYVTNYIAASNAISVSTAFIYYQILQSAPNYDEYSNLQDPAAMNAYYLDWKRLMQKCANQGRVLIDIEPDLNGVMMINASNTNDDSSLQPSSVASSGFPEAAGYPNTFRGFYQTLAHIRNLYAPNVALGLDVSPFTEEGDVVISLRNDPNYNWGLHATKEANYINSLGPGFDMLFYSPLDRDSAYYQIAYGSNRWWDDNNVRQPTFNTMGAWLGRIVALTQKRAMMWQVPNGNRLYRTESNSNGHYQDNRPEYFLNPTSGRSHMLEWANQGVMGIMFGAGVGSQSHYYDLSNDGITNPTPINGNNMMASYPDDDGGYLRLGITSYYRTGYMPLPGAQFTLYDFNFLKTAYGHVVGDPAYNPRGDFNSDRSVDVSDYVTFVHGYGH